jgi:tetraacyldisaccharide 4'-kinase
MRLNEIHERITRREGPWLWVAWLLLPLSWLYALGAWFNRFRFARGLFPRRGFDSVVVSIGNIEVGGVGKTPVTVRIAARLARTGLKTAVVARNLAGKNLPPVAVRPGHSSGAVPLSDEPVFLQRALGRECGVYAGPDKTAAVERAVREMKPDVVIVDDGFQHHRLRRDIDVVVLNADHPFGLGGVLPTGTLRESAGALKNADYLWINGVTSRAQLSLAKRLIASRNWKAPFISSGVVPEKPLRHDGTRDRIGKVVGFCGIGKPEGFRHTLEKTGFKVLRFHIFPDHWEYRMEDLAKLRASLGKSAADYLVTTEKDAARLGSRQVKDMDIRVLPISLSVTDSSAEEELLGHILELAGGHR